MIKGILCDIGGVLYSGDKVIDGAVEAVDELKKRFKIRFLSNTSRKPPFLLYQKLKNLGFHIEEKEIFTALKALKKYLKDKKISAYAVATDEAKEYLKLPFELKAVAICDAYKNFTYDNLNQAFRYLEEGFEFLATNKNRYFKEGNSLSLDAGAFVVGLEYASKKEAKILGKPSCEFFYEAVDDMKLTPSEVVMIGDDIESDILGAKKCGIKTILVKSGKFKKSDLSVTKPDFIVDSIKDAVTICNTL
jgi:HAD superfamily hydrolase (TIGR01458 family)